MLADVALRPRDPAIRSVNVQGRQDSAVSTRALTHVRIVPPIKAPPAAGEYESPPVGVIGLSWSTGVHPIGCVLAACGGVEPREQFRVVGVGSNFSGGLIAYAQQDDHGVAQPLDLLGGA